MLKASMLVFTDPFKIDLANLDEDRMGGAEPEQEEGSGGTVNITLHKAAVFVIQHLSSDWKSLPPLRVVLYRVHDPVHFSEPSTLPAPESGTYHAAAMSARRQMPYSTMSEWIFR